MELLKTSDVSLEMLNTRPLGMPIILCSDTARIRGKLTEAGYESFSLNKELSFELMKIPQSERISHFEVLLNRITEWHAPILLCDFEMLFDPRYKLDALKFICNKSRVVNIAVKWPGEFKNGELIYASPSDSDYHVFNCDSYQIRVVQ